MHTAAGTHIRYRQTIKKPEFLRATKEETSLGRPTRGSELRMAYHILRTGDKSDSVFGRELTKGQLKRDNAKQEQRGSRTRSQEPVYVALTKRLTRQLGMPSDKLYSFLLGSSITKELKYVMRRDAAPSRKSSACDDEKSKHEMPVSKGLKSPQVTLGKHSTFELAENGQRNLSSIYVSPAISQQLHLPKRSDTEGPGRPQDGSTVRLTIIGSPRASFLTSLTGSDSPMGRSSRQGTARESATPLSSRTPHFQIDNTADSAHSPTGKRVVSIPYDPQHVSGDHLRSPQSMYVVGSRPSSVICPRNAQNHHLANGVNDSNCNPALGDFRPLPSQPMKPRPCSAQITRYENAGELGESELDGAHSAGSASARVHQLERFVLSGQTTPRSKRPPIQRSCETVHASVEDVTTTLTNRRSVMNDDTLVSTTPIIQIPSIETAEDEVVSSLGSDSPIESSANSNSYPVRDV